ncbi:hypothetical protein ACJX0J_005790, partial [Zea mays]
MSECSDTKKGIMYTQQDAKFQGFACISPELYQIAINFAIFNNILNKSISFRGRVAVQTEITQYLSEISLSLLLSQSHHEMLQN